MKLYPLLIITILLISCSNLNNNNNQIITPKWAVLEEETNNQTHNTKDYIIYGTINQTIEFYNNNTSFKKINPKWSNKNNTFENEFLINNEKVKISISKNVLCISKTTLQIKRNK